MTHDNDTIKEEAPQSLSELRKKALQQDQEASGHSAVDVLNPESADFDAKAWTEAMEKAGMPITILQYLFHYHVARQAIEEERRLQEQGKAAFVIQLPTPKGIRELARLINKIEAELQQDQYGGQSLADLFKASLDEYGRPKEDSLFLQAVTAADAQIRRSAEITPRRADVTVYPVDKPNQEIWNILEEDTRGQMTLALTRDKDAKKYKNPYYASAVYSIDFAGLEKGITKRLTAFDKLVFVAAGALYNAGNDCFTLTQVYYAMGGTSTPPTRELNKINDAFTKMGTARIVFDNLEESKVYKGYERFRYDGPVIPFERVTKIVNGIPVEGVFHLFKEPPLLTFAKERNQVTTISIKLLQAPKNKTERNLLLQDYLLTRISRERNGRGTNGQAKKGGKFRILYKTIFDFANIPKGKATDRAIETVDVYLDFFCKTPTTEGTGPFIDKYTTDDTGVTIHWSR